MESRVMWSWQNKRLLFPIAPVHYACIMAMGWPTATQLNTAIQILNNSEHYESLTGCMYAMHCIMHHNFTDTQQIKIHKYTHTLVNQLYCECQNISDSTLLQRITSEWISQQLKADWLYCLIPTHESSIPISVCGKNLKLYRVAQKKVYTCLIVCMIIN